MVPMGYWAATLRGVPTERHKPCDDRYQCIERVHLSFAIFAIFDLKGQLKLLEMAFDQVQICLR